MRSLWQNLGYLSSSAILSSIFKEPTLISTVPTNIEKTYFPKNGLLRHLVL